MTVRSARNMFVFGSLFFFLVLIVLTFDTMGRLDQRAPVITETINAGKKVWHKYDCIGCHTIFGNGSYFAPDLTKATERKPRSYLKKFLLDPRAIKPDTAMPKLGLSEQEADELIAFLDWTAGVNTNGWPPKPVLAVAAAGKTAGEGQMLYQRNDCAACHQISGLGGTAGPDLTQVGSRHSDIDWHIRHLKDPASVVSGSAMPDFSDLNESELRALAEYLVTLK